MMKNILANNKISKTWTELLQKYILNEVQKKVIMDVLFDNISTIVNKICDSFDENHEIEALQASYLLIRDAVHKKCPEFLEKTDKFLELSVKTKEEQRTSVVFPGFLDSKIDYNLKNFVQELRNLSVTVNATQEVCEDLTIYQLGKTLSLAQIKEKKQEIIIDAMNQLEFKLHDRKSYVNKDNFAEILASYSEANIIKLGEKIDSSHRQEAVFKFSHKVAEEFLNELVQLMHNASNNKTSIKTNLMEIVNKFDFSRSDNHASKQDSSRKL